MDLKKILILTVGGSCEPIVTSIGNHKPDKIIFICSDDSDSGTKGSYTSVESNDKRICRGKPSIVSQLSLEEGQFETIILKQGYEDNPEKAFSIIKKKIKEIINNLPETEIIADYTGGTKSMSIALFSAAISFQQIKLYLVTGARNDLIKVKNLTQSSVRLGDSAFIEERENIFFKTAIKNFDYSSGSAIIENLLQNQSSLSDEMKCKLRSLKIICQAFNCWDKFDHSNAYELINVYRGKYLEYALSLDKILNTRAHLDPDLVLPERLMKKANVNGTTQNLSYEIVHDLMFNAERKAEQKKYDDAIGRIYRALELFLQIYLLKGYGIKTADVDNNKIPENYRETFNAKYPENPIKLGLNNSYDLITKLEEGNQIGELFTFHRIKILNQLKIRNDSLLAHGFKPVEEDRFNEFYKTLSTFFEECYNTFKVDKKNFGMQFPTNIELLEL